MALNTKAITNRIKSVKNTRKITKAMEMIAAVKMRKAVQVAVNTREYAILANELLNNLSKTKIEHPLTKMRKIEKELFIVITSNKGLCGGYNAKVLKAFNDFIKGKEESTGVIAIGLKAAAFARKKDLKLEAIYEKLGENLDYADIFPIGKSIRDAFINGQYDKVHIVYTNYISGVNQEVHIKQLLPISKRLIESFIKKEEMEENIKSEKVEELLEYEIEPDRDQLLDFVLPALVEIQIYHAIVESQASEHSARMIAMKNASDSAKEMTEDLTLEFNKRRQAGITQEIAEIVSGASALNN